MPKFFSISKTSFSRWRRNWFSCAKSLVEVICVVVTVTGAFVAVTEAIAVLGAVLILSETDAVIDVATNSFFAEVTIASGAVIVIVAEDFDFVTTDSSLTEVLVVTFSARFVVLLAVTLAEGTVSVVIGTPLVILDPVIGTEGEVIWVVAKILVAAVKVSEVVWDVVTVNGEVVVTERGVIVVVEKVLVVSGAAVLVFRVLVVSIGTAVVVFATKISVDGAIAIVAWEVVAVVPATFSVIWGTVTNVEDDLLLFMSGDRVVVIVGKMVVTIIAGSEAVEENLVDIAYDAVIVGVVGVVSWVVNAVFGPVIETSWAVFVFDAIIDTFVRVVDEAGATVFLGVIADT